MRKLAVVVSISLLAGLVGYAAGIEVKLPKRARAGVVQVVDDVGEALFGVKPARVEVANFPAAGQGQLVTVAQDVPMTPFQFVEFALDVSAYEELSLLIGVSGQIAGQLTFGFASGPDAEPGTTQGPRVTCNFAVGGFALGCEAIGVRTGGPFLRVSAVTNVQSAGTLSVQAWVR